MNTELEDKLKKVNAKLGINKHYTYTKKLITKDKGKEKFNQLSLINANKYK